MRVRTFDRRVLLENEVTVVDEQRIVEIESKLAHQELAVEQLNTVVTDQQSRLNRLEEVSQRLLERVSGLDAADTAAEAADERPPHY